MAEPDHLSTAEHRMLSTAERQMHDDLTKLAQELYTLNRHRFIRMHNRPGRVLWFNFTRGLAFGLGSVVGASVLVSVVAFLLAQIDFIPIVGEWAREIADEIQGGNSPADALPPEATNPN